jgi:mannose-6-phosphate isomerase
VHAIGKGVILVEVQQASDRTYRIYDYDRPGLDGKPRELHTELAAQALDFTVLKEYKNSYTDTIDKANPCLDTEHFSVRVVSITHPIRRNMVNYDSFVIMTCTQGECTIRIRSTHDEVTLREGFSCLIPAAIADYDISPITPTAKLLESYINNTSQSGLRRLISQFMHMSGF